MMKEVGRKTKGRISRITRENSPRRTAAEIANLEITPIFAHSFTGTRNAFVMSTAVTLKSRRPHE
jgi:hypothetical protein